MRQYRFRNTSNDTKIIVPLDLYQKMLCYTRASKGEISGFGKTHVEYRQINKERIRCVIVDDIRIFEQPVTGVHTKLTTDVLTPFYLAILDNRERRQWNLWWHSHPTFEVYFSGTDTGSIEILKKAGRGRRVYAICINCDGEMAGHQDDTNGLDEYVKAIVDYNIDPQMIAACNNEVKQKVTYKDINEPESIGIYSSRRLSIFEKAVQG